jgi:hypothetical protein
LCAPLLLLRCLFLALRLQALLLRSMQLLLLPLPMLERLLLLRLKRATLLPRFHRQNRLMLRRQMTQRGLQQALQLRVAPVRVLTATG